MDILLVSWEMELMMQSNVCEADVGISVDTAVDIAKESADIILLQKDLMVLEQGVIEGRRTFEI